MYVHEAMSTSVRSCHADTCLDEVARLMWENDCGAIPVVTDANKPIGIITDRDIAMAAMLNHQPLWELQAKTVIEGQRLSTCGQQESVEQCLAEMEKNRIRRILVTDDSGMLTGILSMGDAVALTHAEGAFKHNSKVSSDLLLGMLRKVSGHHKEAQRPLARAV